MQIADFLGKMYLNRIAFKSRAHAIFSLSEKIHPPGLQNLCSRIFFHYSTLYVPKEAIHIKNWILIAVLRN
jgi:hypothetical protein